MVDSFRCLKWFTVSSFVSQNFMKTQTSKVIKVVRVSMCLRSHEQRFVLINEISKKLLKIDICVRSHNERSLFTFKSKLMHVLSTAEKILSNFK